MDDLLIKYLLEEATAAEKVEVEGWLAAAAENQAYFAQFRTVWDQSKTLAAKEAVDVNAAWQLFQKRIQTRAKSATPLFPSGWWRVAALVLLAVGVTLITYIGLKDKPVPVLTAQTGNTVRKDTLPDGSVITLNKNSSLTYPERFTKDTRSVALKGEAFFRITPDKNKPFIITINDIRIKVIGTSFNVRSEKGLTEVIVATGVVQVQKGNTEVALRPNEKVVVRRQDSVITKERETAQLYQYYESREFVCDNTPLWKLVAVLNKAYDTTIVIGRPELRNLPLTTTFPNESLDRILQIISLTFNIDVEKIGTSIILK
jgi:ferric-dicitrate binding protein FerR (iron transport regulator)